MAIIPIFTTRVPVEERFFTRSHSCPACRAVREAEVQGGYVYVRVNGIPTRVVEESYAYRCTTCGAVAAGARPVDAPAIPFMRRSGHKVALGVLAGLVFMLGALFIAGRLVAGRINADMQAEFDRNTAEAAKAREEGAQRESARAQRDELSASLDGAEAACERAAQATIAKAFPKGLPKLADKAPSEAAKLRDALLVVRPPPAGEPIEVTWEGPLFRGRCRSPLRDELGASWPDRAATERAAVADRVRAWSAAAHPSPVLVVASAGCSRTPARSVKAVELSPSMVVTEVSVSLDALRCTAAAAWIAGDSGAVLASASASAGATATHEGEGRVFTTEVAKANLRAQRTALREAQAALHKVVEAWGG
jgi:hypothetical protein